MRRGSRFMKASAPAALLIAAVALLLVRTGAWRREPKVADTNLADMNVAEQPKQGAAEHTGEMVAAAIDAMKTGVWRVSRGRTSMDDKGHELDKGITDSSGLISGSDFDLTNTHYAGSSDQKIIERRVGVNGKVWSSTDDGKTWKEDANLPAYFMFPADLIWTPSATSDLPLCEVVGTETHDGESWLHVREVVGGGMRDAAHIWLEMDNEGKPLCVRRFALPASGILVTENGREVSGRYEVEDFTPAKEGEKIMPPEGGK
jgi:hypothetical protein